MIERDLPLQEHVTRKLRRLRLEGQSEAEILHYARTAKRNLKIDANRALVDSQLPGSIYGYPYAVAAEQKARKDNAHAR